MMRITPQRLYFILSGNAIKIGIAMFPGGRLADIQSHNVEKVFLIGAVPGSLKQEQALHKELLVHRIHHEWFRATDEVVARVNQMLNQQQQPPVDYFQLAKTKALSHSKKRRRAQNAKRALSIIQDAQTKTQNTDADSG